MAGFPDAGSTPAVSTAKIPKALFEKSRAFFLCTAKNAHPLTNSEMFIASFHRFP